MDHEHDCLVKSSKSLWLQNSIITFLTFAFWQTRCFAITVTHFFFILLVFGLSFWFVVKQKPRLPAEMDVHGDTIPLKKAICQRLREGTLWMAFPAVSTTSVVGRKSLATQLGLSSGGDWEGPGDWFQDTRGICFFNFSKKRSSKNRVYRVYHFLDSSWWSLWTSRHPAIDCFGNLQDPACDQKMTSWFLWFSHLRLTMRYSF